MPIIAIILFIVVIIIVFVFMKYIKKVENKKVENFTNNTYHVTVLNQLYDINQSGFTTYVTVSDPLNVGSYYRNNIYIFYIDDNLYDGTNKLLDYNDIFDTSTEYKTFEDAKNNTNSILPNISTTLPSTLTTLPSTLTTLPKTQAPLNTYYYRITFIDPKTSKEVDIPNSNIIFYSLNFELEVDKFYIVNNQFNLIAKIDSKEISKPLNYNIYDLSSIMTQELIAYNTIGDAINLAIQFQSIGTFRAIDSIQMNSKQLMPTIGPCSRIEISSDDLQFAGIILISQYGGNILNGCQLPQIGIEADPSIPIITGSMTSIPSTNATTNVTDTNINAYNITTNESAIIDALSNTRLISFENNVCDVDSNIINRPTSINLINTTNILKCFDINTMIETLKIIDTNKMFFAPRNTNTTLNINLPRGTVNRRINRNISSILFCMNNLNSTIDNKKMLQSLKISLFGINNITKEEIILAKWQLSESEIITSLNSAFINMIIPKTKLSKFINIKSKSNFGNIYATDVNLSSVIPVNGNIEPTTTLFPFTTLAPTTTTLAPTTTLFPFTTLGNTSTTLGNTSTQVPLTTYGYKISNEYNDSKSYKNSRTNLYQRNFNGTSNIYTPYIYKNVETFVPLNLYNDKYASY